MRNILFMLAMTLILTGCRIEEQAQCPSVRERPSGIMENPFQKCEKGDIITVSALTYENEGVHSVKQWSRDAKHYVDEIISYCSFEHPIINLGSAKLDIQFYSGENPYGPVTRFNHGWFNCVYIGKSRGFR